MKKFIIFIIAAALMLGCLVSCAEKEAENTESETSNSSQTRTETNDKLSIVTTIFPEYDWVRAVLGDNADNAEVTMLLDNGVDLHSYQPTAEDILKISKCDMFVYVGGESDEWVEDALKESVNEDMIVINLLDELGDVVKEEEVKEGMQEEEHDHDHENEHDEDHDEGDHDDEHDEEQDDVEYDEHIWLSLKNAVKLCNVIADRLSVLDADNADKYAANAKAYTDKLTALDGEYQSTVDGAKQKTLLFGDRFPFRYMTDDYGLDYYAAFVGCSAETEASFETIVFLAKKTDELGLNSVMTIEGKDHKIADTIVQNTAAKNQQVLTLDSMQSTTSDDVKNGTTYLSVMEKNLDVLKSALN